MKHPAAFSLPHARRPFALLAVLVFVSALPLRAADAPAIAMPPRLSLSADGGVLAVFDTASPARATLRWGYAPDALTNAATDPGGTHAHVLAFPPLPPDATIYYSATASDGYSFANSFTAPPARAPDASFRFALHGDLEGGLEDNPGHIPYARDVSRGIVAFAPAVVIATGDLADEAYGGYPSFPPTSPGRTSSRSARTSFPPSPSSLPWATTTAATPKPSTTNTPATRPAPFSTVSSPCPRRPPVPSTTSRASATPRLFS